MKPLIDHLRNGDIAFLRETRLSGAKQASVNTAGREDRDAHAVILKRRTECSRPSDERVLACAINAIVGLTGQASLRRDDHETASQLTQAWLSRFEQLEDGRCIHSEYSRDVVMSKVLECPRPIDSVGSDDRVDALFHRRIADMFVRRTLKEIALNHHASTR